MANLRIGTRGSKLALAQSGIVKDALEKANPGLACELIVIKTSGDDLSTPRDKVKGLFVKEIEDALLEKKIDLGIHSVKDMEVDLPKGLAIGAVPKRLDPRDAMILPSGATLPLPPGATIAAGSARRQAQLKRMRRDLEFVPVRGNVDTRLRKLDSNEFGALVLAGCGLIRLGLENRISEYLNVMQVVPCPGQGALALEVQEEDKKTRELIAPLDDADSQWEVRAERAFLKALGGNCDVPIGGLARIQGDSLSILGTVLSPDGQKAIRNEVSGAKSSAERLGKELASHVRAAGSDRLLYGQWASKGKPS
jgi:hydroxymethylbilane synthase